jgi:hypothetical protein
MVIASARATWRGDHLFYGVQLHRQRVLIGTTRVAQLSALSPAGGTLLYGHFATVRLREGVSRIRTK